MQKRLQSIMLVILALMLVLTACSSDSTNEQGQSKEEEKKVYDAVQKEETDLGLINNITLSETTGYIGNTVEFTADQLEPNAPTQLIWTTYDGKWVFGEEYFLMDGPEITSREEVILEGTADANGVWSGSFVVPDGFGGDHTIYVTSNGKKIGQVNYLVLATVEMEPTSGPVGTEITIKVKGMGYTIYKRNWQVLYDNKYTGFISAISSNGTATATIRASGNVGDHVISLRTGHLGSAYINQGQSPLPGKQSPDFIFTVTDEEPIRVQYVEPIPNINQPVELPAPQNKDGVTVTLDKTEGIVGEPVTMEATGLPKNTAVDIEFVTMRGSRVSGNGYQEYTFILDTLTTDDNGNFTYNFEVPDDLGGVPHLLNLKVGDEIYGQTYLRILPSIVSVSPLSGPVGTEIQVTIKGGGWSEYDNAYYLNYDNSNIGYMCSFSSNGTLVYSIIATGEPGYHVIDMYPGMYRQGDKISYDMTIIPQLSYKEDHPGSAMPAIRFGFDITE